MNNAHDFDSLTNISRSFLKALSVGKVCLHPTDTIPGLTFLPTQEKARKHIEKIKAQRNDKKFISLVASLEMALSIWMQLTPSWLYALKNLWPGPLTVIWKTKDPEHSMISDQEGFMALRFPKLTSEDSWLYEVINQLGHPLPSTSVNESKQIPLTSWNSAKEFCLSNYVFVPEISNPEQKHSYRPSTIIKILDDKSFLIIREGAIRREDIEYYL